MPSIKGPTTAVAHCQCLSRASASSLCWTQRVLDTACAWQGALLLMEDAHHGAKGLSLHARKTLVQRDKLRLVVITLRRAGLPYGSKKVFEALRLMALPLPALS